MMPEHIDMGNMSYIFSLYVFANNLMINSGRYGFDFAVLICSIYSAVQRAEYRRIRPYHVQTTCCDGVVRCCLFEGRVRYFSFENMSSLFLIRVKPSLSGFAYDYDFMICL